jgi:hypothetical protein
MSVKYMAYTKELSDFKSSQRIYFSPYTGTTLSAAGTLRVSRVLPAVRFSCLLWVRGISLQVGWQQGKAFCVLRSEVSRSVITVYCEIRARFKKYAILV